MTTRLSCDMQADCHATVTHLDEKGFVYCTEHGITRQNYCYCRKLRPFELRILADGKALPSYAPLSKAETFACLSTKGN